MTIIHSFKTIVSCFDDIYTTYICTCFLIVFYTYTQLLYSHKLYTNNNNYNNIVTAITTFIHTYRHPPNL